eukprot:650582-Hanusia_phi.AAC.2
MSSSGHHEESQDMATLNIAGESLKVPRKSDGDKLFLHSLQRMLKANKISGDMMRVDMPQMQFEDFNSDEESCLCACSSSCRGVGGQGGGGGGSQEK